VRTAVKLWDYFCLSLPVIIAAFIASGFAISMLFADVLSRTDVSDQILQVSHDLARDSVASSSFLIPILAAGDWCRVWRLRLAISRHGARDEEHGETCRWRVCGQGIRIRWAKHGDEDGFGPFFLHVSIFVPACGENIRYSPDIKASLYSFGIARLFVLELGPLLTALLLAGRIGGSYAGEIATMQATNQNRLLRTLGISPVRWTLLPALLAALLAAPVLTLIGTVIALHIGAITSSTQQQANTNKKQNNKITIAAASAKEEKPEEKSIGKGGVIWRHL
jgi:hypothetical protein